MPTTKTLQMSFNGGEMSPQMFGKVDDAKFLSSLSACRNFIATAQGPLINRPGFAMVRAVKNSDAATRIIPFTYSSDQTMVIELGAGYFRFHTQGATLMNGSAPYEVENPYAAADLFDIHYVQSADVMTLVHPSYAPRELRRYGALDWRLVEIDLAPSLSAPTNGTVTPHRGMYFDGAYVSVQRYVVTSVGADQITESEASTDFATTNNLDQTGAYNTLNWSKVAGAWRYNVYKCVGGLYGYIGQTADTSILDDSINADLSKTPPIYDDVFIPNGILSVAITSGGSGYSTTYSGGQIQSVTVEAAGADYGFNTVLTCSDTTGSGATFAVTVEPNYHTITAVEVITQGSLYSSPTFYFQNTEWDNDGTPTSGSGARVSAAISPRVANQVELTVTDSTGSGAVLSAIVVDGVITRIDVISAGRNYTNPTITISDAAGGSGAVLGAVTLSTAAYPGSVSYFEQRRVFGGSTDKPQNIWMTKSGTESNMTYSLPVRDDDRIAFRVSAREANRIRHIVPLSQLLLLTASSEWRVTSVNSDAITPASISVRPQSYIGANNVQPVVVNNSLLYAAARGGHVREMGYDWQASGFITGDVSIRSAHLFDEYDIVDMAYSKAPHSLVWLVSSSGLLLGLTYVPDQKIGAWHRHDTDGVFESCACVAEGREDVLYVVVRRVINGATVRFVERMASRQINALPEAFFVDCGAAYSSDTAVTTVSGLDWLEGKTVSILADGAVQPQQVVTSGTITLEQAAYNVTVGLPIVADAETMPLTVINATAGLQGRGKSVDRVWLRVWQSSGIWVGPDTDTMVEYKPRTSEVYGAPPALKTGELEIALRAQWSQNGQIAIRQLDPLPLTLVSLCAEVSLGG